MKRAIDSLLAQKADMNLFEVILIKNYPRSYIPEAAGDFGVEVIDSSELMGGMLKKGIETAKGEYIAFLDDDDEFIPDKIGELLKVIAATTFDYYHNSNSYVDDDNNQVRYNWRVTLHTGIVEGKVTRSRIRTILQNASDFNMSCTVVRKDVVLKYLHLLDNLSANPDRFFLYMVLDNGGKVYLDKRKLTLYRVHKSTSRPSQDRDDYVARYNRLFTRSLESMDLIRKPLNTPILVSLAEMQKSNLLVRSAILRKDSRMKILANLWPSFKLIFYDFYRYNIFVVIAGLISLMSPKVAFRIYQRFNL